MDDVILRNNPIIDVQSITNHLDQVNDQRQNVTEKNQFTAMELPPSQMPKKFIPMNPTPLYIHLSFLHNHHFMPTRYVFLENIHVGQHIDVPEQ